MPVPSTCATVATVVNVTNVANVTSVIFLSICSPFALSSAHDGEAIVPPTTAPPRHGGGTLPRHAVLGASSMGADHMMFSPRSAVSDTLADYVHGAFQQPGTSRVPPPLAPKPVLRKPPAPVAPYAAHYSQPYGAKSNSLPRRRFTQGRQVKFRCVRCHFLCAN